LGTSYHTAAIVLRRRPLQHGHLAAELDHLGAAPAVYRPRLPYPIF
jgi:hypothetical protein